MSAGEPTVGEPAFGPWRDVSLSAVIDTVRAAAGSEATGAHSVDDAGDEGDAVRVVAVDGRSGAGKTTFAARLAAALPQAAVVHVDDVSWHHSFFDWQETMIEHVLVPARAGHEVAWRPIPWVERGREGRIAVPAGTRWLVLEGCGAARRELSPHLDAALWVASDPRVARARELARDGADTLAFIEEWAAAERPFLERQRPWERVDLVVHGTPAPALADDVVQVANVGRAPVEGGT